MSHRFGRTIPALVSALVVGMFSAGSFAVAGQDSSDQHGSWNQGSGHGQEHKACHGRHVSGLDERWLKVDIETNIFEIKGGEAALRRATSDEVLDLARHLVADHTVALAEATALAERLGIEVPSRPSPLQQWALRAVKTFRGSDFDRWFADLQVEGHRQATIEAQTEVAKGCNRKVRNLAAASLPRAPRAPCGGRGGPGVLVLEHARSGGRRHVQRRQRDMRDPHGSSRTFVASRASKIR